MTPLEITETLLTRLINGNASQYVARFKINCLIQVYTWLNVQLIVVDPFAKGTTGKYYLADNIKNFKMPSYHSIYENACKLQKIFFDQGFLV